MNFRIPAELLDRVKLMASENNRTITAELVGRLEGSFKQEGPFPDHQAKIIADAIMRELDSRAGGRSPIALPDDLAAVDDLSSFQGAMTNRRLAESAAMARLIETTVEKAHAVYEAEGESSQYRELQAELAQLRAFDRHVHDAHVMLLEAQELLSTEAPAPAPVNKRKAK